MMRTVREWGVAVVVVVALLGAILVYASGSSDAVRSTTTPETCASPRPLTPGTSDGTLLHDGTERNYVLYVPESYDGTKRVKSVFLFHGYGRSPRDILDRSGMQQLADQEGFLVVAPLALGEDAKWDFRSPATVPNSDIAFARQLADEVRGKACVDPDGMFAAGFSNGAAFALAAACDPETPFGAFAAVSGPYYAPTCSYAPPASIAIFHGLVDSVVPYDGASTVIGPLPAVDDAVADWVRHDNCPTDRARTLVDDGVRHYSWRDCAQGTQISVYAVRDLGHRWPAKVEAGAGQGPASIGAIDASRLMWDFFVDAQASGRG